jgi:hypothetical protein
MSDRNSIAAGWIVIVLILCQFIPLDRTNPPSANPAGIPSDVRAVLKAHCYRCHSNETKWPPSAYIAPLSWIVVREVHEARNALNFSNYQDKPVALRSAVNCRIHKIANSGNLTSHDGIPGFQQIRMTGQERRLLLDWTSDNNCEP